MTEMSGPSSQQSAPLPTSGFTKFPELPTELQLKIWNYAARVPRALELQYCIVDRKFLTFQHPPAILHTCKVSREFALGPVYHLSFGTDRHPPTTYFNPFYDTIYFGSRQYDDEIAFIVNHFYQQSGSLGPRDQIQSLAIAEHLWRYDYPGNPVSSPRPSVSGSGTIVRFHQSFPHLKELIFVKSRPVPDGSEDEIEAHWENFNGISLVDSTCRDVVTDPNFVLKALISVFQTAKEVHADELFPEVKVMTYGFSGITP
jgi:hypothetical protein